MKVFGAYRPSGFEAVAAPVGKPCHWCQEPIEVEDDGFLIEAAADCGQEDAAADCPAEQPELDCDDEDGAVYHRNCYLRQMIGSVGQQMGEGSEGGDPPEMSARQAADAAVTYYEDHRPKSITCPRCGWTSENYFDVTHQYCGRCHKFHGSTA